MKNKIYDCITFFEENLQFDLRFNILKNYVHKFIVCESNFDHKGNYKGINFKPENYTNFKNKIIHLVIKNQFPDTSDPWKTQAYQREYIFNGLSEALPEDYIMFSDPDEIPRPELLANINLENKYGIFMQDLFKYKLNIFNPYESPWEGTRVCRKKNLKSINFLRSKILKKNLRYPFWRIDKIKDITIFNNGGWHFSDLMSPEKISKKLKTFAHSEFAGEEFSSVDIIKEKIKQRVDLFNRDHVFSRIKIDKNYPKYITDNLNQFRTYIEE
tara:strand:- start:101 stop:913 length:813 start_codon:yes stop_codon:yes gene_type:complete